MGGGRSLKFLTGEGHDQRKVLWKFSLAPCVADALGGVVRGWGSGLAG